MVPPLPAPLELGLQPEATVALGEFRWQLRFWRRVDSDASARFVMDLSLDSSSVVTFRCKTSTLLKVLCCHLAVLKYLSLN